MNIEKLIDEACNDRRRRYSVAKNAAHLFRHFGSSPPSYQTSLLCERETRKRGLKEFWTCDVGRRKR